MPTTNQAIFIAFVTALISTSAEAATLEDCKSFSDKDNRLKCYDDISGYVESTTEGQVDEAGKKSSWQFIEKQDAFTSKNNSYVILKSDAAGATFSDKPAALIVRCVGGGGYDLYVISNGYIGGDSIPVRYKFDGAEPISERWGSSTDGKAAFLGKGYKDFVNGLKSGENFIFEMTDYNGTKSMAKFDGNAKDVEELNYVLGGCKGTLGN